ncbi:hypothetical protein EJ08DRAFT_728009 [Tothia fuscella]|uniref:Uncharacterized protein n=1 Tax=Tothia fuscella TaxID=1048955 RepID=A0A9P4TTX7_9PEZI|nr:hypothetical protein EJ08DRAFT_728009 [Tothia fuscella]
MSDLIQVDHQLGRRLELREIILASHQESVQATPESEAAVSELYQFLTYYYLPRRFPAIFEISNFRRSLINTALHVNHPLNTAQIPEQTLRALGVIVDEDFMLLQPALDGDGYVLGAFIACFASGFPIGNILGKRLRELHDAVPGYEEKLKDSMERWFSTLSTGKMFRRHNWTVTLHGNLKNVVGQNQNYSQPEDIENWAGDQDDEVDQAHLRTELQNI